MAWGGGGGVGGWRGDANVGQDTASKQERDEVIFFQVWFSACLTSDSLDRCSLRLV